MERYNTTTSKAALKPLKANQYFNQYLAVKKGKRTLIDVFMWWEKKRIPFNITVIALYYSCFEIQKLSTQPTSDLFTTRGAILFFIGYNIIYSSFCVLEFITKKSETFAPKMIKNILFICIAAITMPTLFHILKAINS